MAKERFRPLLPSETRTQDDPHAQPALDGPTELEKFEESPEAAVLDVGESEWEWVDELALFGLLTLETLLDADDEVCCLAVLPTAFDRNSWLLSPGCWM